MKKTHDVPSENRILSVIRGARRMLRKEPEDISAGYRRGLVEALKLVLGSNANFERLLRRTKGISKIICNCDASGWPATSRIGKPCDECGGIVIDGDAAKRKKKQKA